MSPQIIQTSTYISHILHSTHTGIIHSVYRKTINLSAGDAILALQAADSALSPLSLRTNLSGTEMAALRAAAGQPVILSPSFVQIRTEPGPAVFSICKDQCEISDMHLHGLAGSVEASALSDALKCAVTSSGVGGFSLILTHPEDIGDDPVLMTARQIIQSAGTFYARGEWAAAADALVRLIGLGTGLTPGGDDFLCGVLAGLILLGKEEEPFGQILRDRISAHLFDTVDISRAFLCLALQGEFSFPVLSLASLRPDQKNLTQTFRSSFESIGHTSGMDTLCGIYFITSAGR